MNRTLEKLLVLQDLDVKIRQSEKEMRDIPARKEAQASALNTHKAAVEQAQERLKEHLASIRNLETEVAARKENIAKLRVQQYDLKTNNEFRTMESEIRAIEKHILEIEDRELGFMDKTDPMKFDIETAQNELKEEASAIQAQTVAMDERLNAATEQAEILRKERSVAAATIETDETEWLNRYNRLIERKDLAVVQLTGNGVCTGCQMRVPPQTAQDARKPGKIVSCDHCGCLLYC